jgi:peptidoglycan/xylan/chitin deacetylase (PgdA/CDA1 family)
MLWRASCLIPSARTRADAGIRVEDVAALIALGMDIGFHTLRHRALPTLSEEELRQALGEGRQALEAIVGRPLVAIAYPHGKIDDRTVPAARAAGYRQGFTTIPQAVTPASDPLAMGRIAPSPRSTLELAARLAAATCQPATGRQGHRRDSSQAGPGNARG